MKNKYLSQVNNIAMGDVNDFNNFMNAVIDEASFDNISNYIDYAKNSSESKIISLVPRTVKSRFTLSSGNVALSLLKVTMTV